MYVCMYVWVCVYVCVRVSAASPAVAADVTPSHYLPHLQAAYWPRPGQVVGYHVESARSMPYLEVVRLQGKVPSCDSGIVVLHGLDPG